MVTFTLDRYTRKVYIMDFITNAHMSLRLFMYLFAKLFAVFYWCSRCILKSGLFSRENKF